VKNKKADLLPAVLFSYRRKQEISEIYDYLNRTANGPLQPGADKNIAAQSSIAVIATQHSIPDP
jgi:hypothetical protein